MISISTLAFGLSVLVLNITALPLPDPLEIRDITPSMNDTINAYDISLKQVKTAISSHPESSFDVVHTLEKRDDVPNVSLVLSLLERHGFQPVTTIVTVSPKATVTLTTKVTTMSTPKATSPSIPTTKASITLTTKATSTSITKTTTISTTKATITLTSKAISTLTAKATTILATKAISTLTAKATTTTATTKTATTTTKATTAAHARDLF